MRKRDIYLIFGTKIVMPARIHGNYKIIWTLLDATDRWAIYCTIIYTFLICFFLWREVYIFIQYLSLVFPLTFLALRMMKELVYCVPFFTMCFVLQYARASRTSFWFCMLLCWPQIDQPKGLSDGLNSNDWNGAAASVNEVIDGPAMLLLKIPQAELSGAAGYPQSNPTCVLR